MMDRAGETQVSRAHVRLLARSCPVTGLGEDERADRNRELADLVRQLAEARSVCAADVWRKLTIVADRLQFHGHVRSAPFAVLTMLLLDSARDDLRLLG